MTNVQPSTVPDVQPLAQPVPQPIDEQDEARIGIIVAKARLSLLERQLAALQGEIEREQLRLRAALATARVDAKANGAAAMGPPA